MPEFPEKLTEASESSQHSQDGQQAKPSFIIRPLALIIRVIVSPYGLLALGAIGVGLLIYLAASDHGLMKNRELRKEKGRLEAEIEILKDENRLLTERRDRLKNDPALVEDEARKKLGLVRPGEKVFRLAEEPDMSESPARPPSQDGKN